ncbi:MAG: zf-TFIIB domain-containing protein [Halioglobus sp.]
MKCPKCSSVMMPVEFGTDIKVSRCVGCRGLYCERKMLDSMREEWLVDTVLDTGSPTEGARYNDVLDVDCPGCGAKMDRVQDEEQTHIVLDVCSSCDGVFLDAGELTDIKNITLMDHVRRLLTGLGR